MLRTWQFDPSYTTVEFSVSKHWFFNVKGSFERIEGQLSTQDADVTQSSVTAHLKVESLNTGDKKRDGRLRSVSFFDGSSFPELIFSSTSINRGQDRDMLDVTGTLLVKGKSHEVKLKVSEMDRSRSPKGEEFVYYSATTEFDRYALGLKGMPGLSRQLKVTINVQARLVDDF